MKSLSYAVQQLVFVELGFELIKSISFLSSGILKREVRATKGVKHGQRNFCITRRFHLRYKLFTFFYSFTVEKSYFSIIKVINSLTVKPFKPFLFNFWKIKFYFLTSPWILIKEIFWNFWQLMVKSTLQNIWLQNFCWKPY